jgi:glycosyltransferase involved in cell wall biosynthesis
MMQRSIAVVMSGFPRLSETFATNELLRLKIRGELATIFATKSGDSLRLSPQVESLWQQVRFLSEGTAEEQGAEVAKALAGSGIRGIHGYFAHKPAEVALHAAKLLDVPYGFSVHAKDARKITAGQLCARAKKAACVVACNHDVAETVRECGSDPHLMPHGVDLERFNDTSSLHGIVLQILAVGRLCEKKGFDVLVRAATKLNYPFNLRIVGGGPDEQKLKDLISTHNLRDRVTLCGPMDHNSLPAEYSRAEIVVAPSIVDGNGDRDGLPNVVLEAMASARAVVASNVGDIASAVKDGVTGILTEPGNSEGIAEALNRLGVDADLRGRLGNAARQFVEKYYDLTTCSNRFCELLQEAYV